MLIRRRTPDGLRVRTCAGGIALMLHVPLAASMWGLGLSFISESSDWVARLMMSALVQACFWFSVRLLTLGIEFRSDSIVVHSFIKKTVIYREELRAAACWYDRGSADSPDVFGVAFAFDPTRPSADGSPRGASTGASLAPAKLMLPSDIRSIAVLIQQWWQTGPATILPDGEPVVRVVRPSGYEKTRDEVLDEFPEWWVLYDAVEPKRSLMRWTARPAM